MFRGGHSPRLLLQCNPACSRICGMVRENGPGNAGYYCITGLRTRTCKNGTYDSNGSPYRHEMTTTKQTAGPYLSQPFTPSQWATTAMKKASKAVSRTSRQRTPQSPPTDYLMQMVRINNGNRHRLDSTSSTSISIPWVGDFVDCCVDDECRLVSRVVGGKYSAVCDVAQIICGGYEASCSELLFVCLWVELM
jgi:hypothetical protein